MGCTASGAQHQFTIDNNIVVLAVTKQTRLLIQKIESMGDAFNYNAPINFKGDTVLHYAVAKEDIILVEYLIKKPDVIKSIRNRLGQTPKDLTKNPVI